MIPRARAALAVLLLGAGQGLAEPRLERLDSFSWSDPPLGGLSSLELSADGRQFITVSDRGLRIEGLIRREGTRIAGLEVVATHPIRRRDGQIAEGVEVDSEGLACREPAIGAACDISFEEIARVAQFETPDSAARNRPRPGWFNQLQANSGLEALAVDGAGRLYAIPERSGDLERPFPVYRLDGAHWSQPFALERRPPYLPVGADFDAEGRLYVLERQFATIAFSSRVRRLTLDGDRIVRDETLLQTPLGLHDNLEGIAVWTDAEGATRVTMISDDNQNIFQRTELVDYRLVE